MKKWKRKYKELKEDYLNACKTSRERATEVSKLKIELGRGDLIDEMNVASINCYNIPKDENGNIKLNFGPIMTMEDSSIRAEKIKNILDSLKTEPVQFFNEDKTPIQTNKLTNEAILKNINMLFGFHGFISLASRATKSWKDLQEDLKTYLQKVRPNDKENNS